MPASELPVRPQFITAFSPWVRTSLSLVNGRKLGGAQVPTSYTVSNGYLESATYNNANGMTTKRGNKR